MKRLSKEQLEYFQSLNIDTDSKYFRSHYRRGLLNEIDEDFVEEIQAYFLKHFNEKVDPITHIAFANLLDNKDVRVIPQLFYRKRFLNVFNDNAMNDMYRDKGLYDILINTDQKAHNVVKFTRGQFITDTNKFIDEHEAYDIILNDRDEYILKPSDTNNGRGITKLKVKDNKLYIDEEEVNLEDLQKKVGYNYLIQRVIKQHEVMAKPHPNSVNTLRMATLRWKGKIHNVYTFARFGHSGDIKDNAGAGGLVVGVKNDGTFMDYGIVRSKKVYEHPTTNIKISDFGQVPNMDEVNKFVRDLHRDLLLQNYVAWDIAIDQQGKPIFIENNFYGGSWNNQIALNQPMFGDLSDDILQHVAKNEPVMIEKNLESISARRRQRILKLRENERKNKRTINKMKKKIKRKNRKIKQLEKENDKIHYLENEIKRIKNSKSWRYTRFFRRK